MGLRRLARDGRYGQLRPIRLQAMCVQCHGPAASIDAAVRRAIEQRYPEDEAIGFEANDLRGYSWAEVPSEERR